MCWTPVSRWVQLAGSYSHGPYYKNDRNARGNPFQYVRGRLGDNDPVGVVGINSETIPIGGWSVFDSMGSSVCVVIPYGRGMVVFLGSSFSEYIERRDGWVEALHAAVRM